MNAQEYVADEIEAAIDRLAWLANEGSHGIDEVADEYLKVIPALYALLEEAKREYLMDEVFDPYVYNLVEAILQETD